MDQNTEAKRPFAKRIFFLYPHSVIQDQLITLLVQSEYEVATINDYQKASALLYRYPSSIIFINIEAELKDDEWEQYIKGLLASREKHDARIGILTYNSNTDLAQKYLMDIGIQCGFIVLKLGVAESTKIILKTLEANEAKGGRRFVRVKCPPSKATINVNVRGRLVTGDVLDISSAGLACILDEHFENGAVIEDVQLSLWGSRMKQPVKVAGVREDNGKKILVLMFEKPSREVVGKIYSFIKRAIQFEVDQA